MVGVGVYTPSPSSNLPKRNYIVKSSRDEVVGWV